MSTLDDASVVDVGAHLHPESVVPEPMAAFDEWVGARHTDPDALARWYAETPVDAAVLSQPAFMGHGDADVVAEANDALLAAIDPHDQFHGLAAVPTAAGGEAAAAELERCLDAGYLGGAVETRSGGVELTDAAAEAILEVADRTGAPLLVHPKLNDSLGPGVLDDAYRLNAIFGREAALSASISRVIHDGVLERYPDLTLVYHHLGGNVASMLGRVRLQLDPGRWPGGEAARPWDEFEAVLTDRIYVDSSGFFAAEGPLVAALEAFPPSQILFGTDVPYEFRTHAEVRRAVATVEEVADPNVAARILGDNAAEVLG